MLAYYVFVWDQLTALWMHDGLVKDDCRQLNTIQLGLLNRHDSGKVRKAVGIVVVQMRGGETAASVYSRAVLSTF